MSTASELGADGHWVKSALRPLRIAIVCAASACAGAARETPPVSWCGSVPRPVNAAFASVDVASDWFDVRRVEPGIFAINQPRQAQEAIAYLIVGSTRALLFDTGIGLVPVRPIVERLTTLPVTVINSHSHFDHVGGNAEFSDVWGMETAFTRDHETGRPHADLASEVASDAFCDGPPSGVDTAAFRSRAWRTTHRFRDGERVDIGGRVLELLHVPGHTPDAVALLDRAHGLLWTGDSYYDATIWLFSPGTDVEAYERSLTRLVALAPSLRRLLPAHNTISEPPARLLETLDAFRALRKGQGVRVREAPGQLRVTVGGVSFLVRQ